MEGRTARSSLPRAGPVLWRPRLHIDSDDVSDGYGDCDGDGDNYCRIEVGDEVIHRSR